MKTIYEQRCRICGCDWNHACNDHDYWFAEDLCSACAERMKPILFNTEMVRAILDGRKTTTRRVIKPQPENAHMVTDISNEVAEFMCGEIDNGFCIDYAEQRKLPYQPGDILYVRETFAIGEIAYGEEPDGTAVPFISQCIGENGIIPKEYALRHGIGIEDVVWKPSLHMPKEAARIFLHVTDVRAERLQDMFASDVSNEGIYFTCPKTADEMIKAFSQLWDTTVKQADRDKYGWAANPWVWVITFERIGKLEENADA